MTRKKPTLFAALLLSCATAGGCTFARSEVNNKDLPALVKEMKPGQTTEDDLVRSIGTPPGQIIMMPSGNRLLVYSYGQSKTKGLTLLVFNVSKTNAAVDTAIFLVNKQGVVEEAWVGDNSGKIDWEWWAFGE